MKIKSCYFCDQGVTRFEMDHFPIPRRFGGTSVVVACLTCHDFKDRMLLDDWPEESRLDFFSLFQFVVRDGVCMGYPLFAHDSVAISEIWSDLNRWQRLGWAKVNIFRQEGIDIEGLLGDYDINDFIKVEC